MMIYLSSACLIGLCTRYDGRTNTDEYVLNLFREGKVIPVCPEQLGGLPTPREPVEFKGGDAEAVLQGKARLIGLDTGKDWTDHFIRGAIEVMKLVKILNLEAAFLMDRSPSCGSARVHVDGKVVEGMGVTAYLLKKSGIKLIVRAPEGSDCQETSL